MNRIWVTLMFLAVSAIAVQAADLKSYKDVYDRNLEELVLGHGPKLVEIGQQYGKALEALKATVQGQGDLEKTKAVMAEIERFRKNKGVPPSSLEAEIIEIRNLQVVSNRQMTDLELEKARKVITLATQYDGALDRLQKDLTKAGKLDDATAIQDERNKVKNSDYLLAANKVTAAAPGKDNNNIDLARNAANSSGRPNQNVQFKVSGTRQPDRPAYLGRLPLLEGFSKPLEWHARKSWGTYRDEEQQSFWAHAKGEKAQIAWETQPVDRMTAPSATFVFGGGMGFDKERTGTWNVEVNGQQVLQVKFPVEESTLWEHQGCRLYFEHRGEVHLGYKGIFFLTVPRQILKMDAIQQVRFRENAQSDNKDGWVMVNEYADMVADISEKRLKKVKK